MLLKKELTALILHSMVVDEVREIIEKAFRKKSKGRPRAYESLTWQQERVFIQWCKGEIDLKKAMWTCGVSRATLFRYKKKYF